MGQTVRQDDCFISSCSVYRVRHGGTHAPVAYDRRRYTGIQGAIAAKQPYPKKFGQASRHHPSVSRHSAGGDHAWSPTTRC